MRVTALLFNQPGRGEFLRKHFDMPDAEMPKTPDEFALRSVRAMKHFWPDAPTGKAITLDKCEDGARYVVEGGNWSVEWATDAQMEGMRGFISKYMEGDVSSDDFIAALTRVQPTERVDL